MSVPRILLCACLALPAVTAPGGAAAAAVWSRESALAAAGTVDARPLVEELQQMTVAGDGPGALALLERTHERGDWPAPARDAALYRYVDRLRDLPAPAVPPRVLRWLRAVEPLTLVPHEDHAGGLVPLFSVRAAVAGLEHGWLRDEARLEGAALLEVRPAALTDLFLIETHPAARSGYLAALEQAGAGALEALALDATERLKAEPALTPLAGRAALLAGDRGTLTEVLVAGEGAEVHRLLRSAALLAPAESAALLDRLLEDAGAETAAAALGILYPAARGVPGAREAVLGRLGDPVLGASAALALAGDDAPGTHSALRSLAAGDGLAAARARLALSLAEEDLLR